MSAINNITLVGRLVRPPERKGDWGATFTLAVNAREKVNGEWQKVGHFFDCVAFGKRAEALCQYAGQGDLISVSGSLRQRKWEQNGERRSAVSIAVDDWETVARKERAGAPGGDQAPAPSNQGRGDYSPQDVPF